MSGPPEWLRVWAAEIEANDLIRFAELGDSVRLVGRDYPGAYSPVFTIELPDRKTHLGKMAQIFVFDPDGSVRRRVQLVIEAVPA